MAPGELAAVRGRLEEFAAGVFAPLVRCDQRDKGAIYVRGLLLDGDASQCSRWPRGWGSTIRGCSNLSTLPPLEPVRHRLAARTVAAELPRVQRKLVHPGFCETE